MAGSAYYSTGTASVVEGERVVTGLGTGWLTQEGGGLSPIKAGDKFGIHVGRPILIDSVDSNTQITLADPWPGPSQEAAPYKVELTSPQIIAIDAMRRLFASLSSGNLTSLAGLQLDDQQIPIAIGPGVFGTIDKNDLVQGVTFDAEVPFLADRAAYDSAAKGFRVLVSDIGNGRSAFFSKTSAAVADWSVPFYLSGEQGEVGPFTELTFGPVTTLPAGEPASVNVVPIDADTIRLDLSLPKGADGEGGGDVIGPSGATDGAIAVADGVTGKQIKFVTPAQARATIGAGGPLATYRNQIINGGFDVWQRQTAQTSIGYGSDDRWINGHFDSPKTTSRQAFTPGQTDVPGNPKYFSRTVVTSISAPGNYVNKAQLIEDVGTLAGTKATLTFYARADGNKNIAVDLAQIFGTGGGASGPVLGIGARKVLLTTAWQRYSLVFDVPGIAGKTIGTSGTDALALTFWFEAGANFAARTDGLGQQSGTFDLARVSLVEGDASAEDDPFSPRHIQQELALCQRYYEIGAGVALAADRFDYPSFPFKVSKRAPPTITTNPAIAVQAAVDPLWGFWQDTPHSILSGLTWTAAAEL